MTEPNGYTPANRPEGSGRFSSGKQKGPGRTKGLILLGLAFLVFLASVYISVGLIYRSASTQSAPTETEPVKPLDYLINEIPTQPITQDAADANPIDLRAPESQYDSPMINILLMGVEEEKNDTLILCSVHLAERTLSLLAIPRDTYVAGDYEVPKVNSIYANFQPQRRVEAVKEAVKGMFGFAPDYYLILDEALLACMVDCVGGLDFSIPSEPAYHSLKAGNHSFTSQDAFELFRYKESWDRAGYEPTKVQRDFLLKLFEALLADKSKISENCIAISQLAQTDLSLEELAYLAYLLADYSFEEAYSSPLLGTVKEIDGESYFEVDPEKAVKLLNEHHNPLKKELSVFNVNFRQEQTDSGEGEYSDYGNFTKTEESSKNTDTTGKKPKETTTKDTEEDPEEETEENTEENPEEDPEEDTEKDTDGDEETVESTTEEAPTEAPSSDSSEEQDTTADSSADE